QIMWVTTGARRSGMTTTSSPFSSVKVSTFGPVARLGSAVAAGLRPGVASSRSAVAMGGEVSGSSRDASVGADDGGPDRGRRRLNAYRYRRRPVIARGARASQYRERRAADRSVAAEQLLVPGLLFGLRLRCDARALEVARRRVGQPAAAGLARD